MNRAMSQCSPATALSLMRSDVRVRNQPLNGFQNSFSSKTWSPASRSPACSTWRWGRRCMATTTTRRRSVSTRRNARPQPRCSWEWDSPGCRWALSWSSSLCDALGGSALPMSSEISDLLLFVSYLASQSKGIKFGDYFFWCVLCKLKRFG